MNEFPQSGETVVCRVTKILDYGVFVELLEFENLAGFVHISQVSTSWIKNIRNFVKENQVRAAQVIAVDRQKRQVDLSLNKVSAGTQRARIEEWKQGKRSVRLLEMIAKKNNSTLAACEKEVAQVLLEKYETLFDAFQEIRLERKDALELVPKKWLSAVKEVVEKNIELPSKEIKGVLSVSLTVPDGVAVLRQALEKAEKAVKKSEGHVEVSYLGSGNYMLRAVSFDYKSAEKAVKASAEAAEEYLKPFKAVVSFKKS
ncbi:MAG: S1 RNA-binding domain-containing protein [Candidatus Diapherotrites archaeon]|nr:S1 RNA-binding domain-containing protein [Candidatus Diapherotrites archaeon]